MNVYKICGGMCGCLIQRFSDMLILIQCHSMSKTIKKIRIWYNCCCVHQPKWNLKTILYDIILSCYKQTRVTTRVQIDWLLSTGVLFRSLNIIIV